VEADRQRSHLSLAHQIRLVRPEMRLIQPVRPTLEMSGKLLDSVKIRRDGRGREVTPLEFLQHDLATMGHKTTPVTPTRPIEGGVVRRTFNCEHERAQLTQILEILESLVLLAPSCLHFATRCGQCSADDRNQRAAGSTTSFGKLDPSSGTLIIAAAPRPGRRVPRRGPVTQPLPR
jgi:hypothetical protein